MNTTIKTGSYYRFVQAKEVVYKVKSVTETTVILKRTGSRAGCEIEVPLSRFKKDLFKAR